MMNGPITLDQKQIVVALRVLAQGHDSEAVRAFAHRFEIELDRLYGRLDLVPAVSA